MIGDKGSHSSDVGPRAELLVAGDLCPIGSGLRSLMERPGTDVFQAIQAELGEADLAIANLECPLCDLPNPQGKTGPSLRAPEACAARIRAAGFGMVSLANNHIRDHGDEGVRSTLRACAESGLETVGAGTSIGEAQRLKVLVLGGLRVAFMGLCESEFSTAGPLRAGANPIDPLRLARQLVSGRSDWDALVVLLHSGREHYPYPTPRQQGLCRALVDLGASVVVCQHSHCVGCIERVGNRLIVYGQGNLLFDSPGRVPDSWFEGFGLQLSLGPDGVTGFRVVPYRQSVIDGTVHELSGGKREQMLLGIERRSNEILDDRFVEEAWRAHVGEVAEMYLLWLAGSGWFDRLRLKLSHLAGRRYRPLTSAATRRLANLLRCETHREILETVLAADPALGEARSTEVSS